MEPGGALLAWKLGRARMPKNAFALALALILLLYRVRGFPLDYLFVPDREIWQAQVLSWLGLLGEAVIIFLIVRWVLGAVSRWRARSSTKPGSTPPFPNASRRAGQALNSPFAPWAFGIVTALAMLWVWQGFDAPTYIHDEAAYLLQARLLAAGHWKEPALPLPQFFDQMYVFTTPFHTGKYPPGFPLALVPGIWLGVPLLVPLACAGVAGSMLFSLARRITNPWAACFAWLIFTTAPRELSAPPPYMSQWLTLPLWLIGFGALLRWRETGRFREMLLLALVVGWCAITRPLTAFAFAIPAGFTVLRAAFRRRQLSQLAGAALAGALVLGLLPLWNYEVTGSVKTSPLVLNVKATTPYDQLGVDRKVPPPLHELPPDLRKETRLIGQFSLHREWSDLPVILGRRLNLLVLDWLGSRRMALLPLIVAALFLSSSKVLFASGVCALDILAYLLFPHPPQFTMYYMEIQPVLALLAAIGLFELLKLLTLGERTLRPDPATARLCSVTFVVIVLLAGPAFLDLQSYAERERANQGPKRRLLESIRTVSRPAIIFVRYAPDHSPFQSLVENGADFPRQPVWMAYDRGTENGELLALAPERHAYLFDEKANSLRPYFPEGRTAATMARTK